MFESDCKSIYHLTFSAALPPLTVSYSTSEPALLSSKPATMTRCVPHVRSMLAVFDSVHF